jgi:2-keto-4-pentenoate hydratase/2-oxohepta-3-ene-1,7-dioic acid hydratase in catechol pathway
MLVCRYHEAGQPQYGIIDQGVVYHMSGDLFADPSAGKRVGLLNDVQLLAPIMPSKIICVGRNYAAHAKELGNEVPTEPLLFFKPPSSIIGHEAAIELLPEMGKVDHEAELAVVIKRAGRFISKSDALSHVLGYTCANDVSDRDFQKGDGQWTRAKGFDTFCPLGPWVETEFDPSDVRVTGIVNGELRQDGRTSQLVFDVPYLISYISRIMTLMPGDLVLTGTPAGVGPLVHGDSVEVTIEGLGTLRNSVIKREDV